jgi:hypothetical protein
MLFSVEAQGRYDNPVAARDAGLRLDNAAHEG